jgi:hypothetical protein
LEEQAMNLRGAKTIDLINELANRTGVQKISVGPYQSYELRKKYARRRSTDGTRGCITADAVLVIPNLNHLDA